MQFGVLNPNTIYTFRKNLNDQIKPSLFRFSGLSGVSGLLRFFFGLNIPDLLSPTKTPGFPYLPLLIVVSHKYYIRFPEYPCFLIIETLPWLQPTYLALLYPKTPVSHACYPHCRKQVFPDYRGFPLLTNNNGLQILLVKINKILLKTLSFTAHKR